MKPLRVLVIVKNTPAASQRENRPMGLFSYPVPEFTWDFISLGKAFRLDTRQFQGKYDLIFHEDGGNWGDYAGDALPVVYYAIDSTLSESFHFEPRLIQSQRADLVLVDHDDLSRFRKNGKAVERLSHCVNDLVFKPADYADNDIAYHCTSNGHMVRAQVRLDLDELCKGYGWRYRSGGLALEDYARSMATSHITVNVPRNLDNRPHRLFDALACKTLLLTYPFPRVSLEYQGVLLNATVQNFGELAKRIRFYLQNLDVCKEESERGYRFIKRHHTWRIRAYQLREILDGYFCFNQ